MDQMKNTKVTAYLKDFSTPELKRLQLFMNSPYSKVFAQTQNLFKLLIKFHPNYEDDDLGNEKIFTQLFPGKPFNRQLLGDQLKYLGEAIEEFIAVEQLRKKEGARQILVLDYLKKKNLKLYKDGIDKLALAVKKKNAGDSGENILMEINYHDECDTYFSLNQSRTMNNAIQLKSDTIDTWYIYQKLKIWCDMQNRQNILSAEYNYTLKEELFSFIEKNRSVLFEKTAIRVYYLVYKTLENPEDEEGFVQLAKLLEASGKEFVLSELQTFYQFAQNYCIKKLNSGNTAYAEKLFGIYETMLKNNILIADDGTFSVWDYKNIVTLSLRLKKEKWCRDFIEKYVPLLAKKERENAYAYNLAYYYAHIEDYSEAKKLLQRVEFSDLFYQLGSRSILLKCYYELRDEESFLAHCLSFQKFLERNKTVSDYQKKVHLNLILYTKKVFRVSIRREQSRSSVSKKEIGSLKEKIVNIKAINNLQWLLEKTEEML